MPVLDFKPSAQEGRLIPRPIFYQPGDRYSTVAVEGDVAGLPAGCELYLKHDYAIPGCTHIVLHEGENRFGFIPNYGPMRFEWHTYCPEMPSGTYRWADVKLVGAIVEIWSFGIGKGKPRWVFNQRHGRWAGSEHLGRLLNVSVG